MALSPTTSRGGSTGALALLSTTTLAVDGTFDVSGIDQTYNSLRLIVIARNTRAATSDGLILRFNNDSAANYTYEYGDFNAAGVTVAGVAAPTFAYISPVIPAASAGANRFAMAVVDIPGYRSTTWTKAVLAFCASIEDTSARSTIVAASRWNSTAAITRIQVLGEATANLLTGSVLYIYGVT